MQVNNQQIQNLKNAIISSANKVHLLQKIKPEIFGKDGAITQMMQKIKDLQGDVKKEYAQSINILKNEIEALIKQKLIELEKLEIDHKLAQERIDETLPIPNKKFGIINPITKVKSEIVTILEQFQFSLFEGYEIESFSNNFTKLNFPQDHPAVQMHDTFYISGVEKMLLRTHTSNAQIRAMEECKLPLRIISAGKVYRHDSDATHSPMFHQIECLYVDHNVNMSQMYFLIQEMLSHFFESKIEIFFRPSFFPFTEPSAEIDLKWNDRMLEIGGCGMVHPNVLINCNIDPNQYQGFAFGFGIERMAMIKYNISDIRSMFSSTPDFNQKNGFQYSHI